VTSGPTGARDGAPERRVWIRSVGIGADLSTDPGREMLRGELLKLLAEALTELPLVNAAQSEAEVA